MKKGNLYFAVLLLTLIFLSGCGNKNNSYKDSSTSKGSCVDVTSIDYNWKNDMKCTRSDGSVFYTDYAGAREFEN